MQIEESQRAMARSHTFLVGMQAEKITIRKKRILRRFKEQFPCEDCSQQFPHYVMELDHREGQTPHAGWKRKHEAFQWNYFAWRTIFLELDLVDLVCANCHRVRTWAERRGAS